MTDKPATERDYRIRRNLWLATSLLFFLFMLLNHANNAAFVYAIATTGTAVYAYVNERHRVNAQRVTH